MMFSRAPRRLSSSIGWCQKRCRQRRSCRAEARVAGGISSGQTVDDIAASLSLSRETIRTQLKAVFAKVGVSRQVDLVNLLAGRTIP
jgi:DNA-binding CsgD family transcriptional regulator